MYLGSASGLAATPAWQAESDQAFAEFGWSVAGAGDVNGDGYADVIVGAIFFDNGQTNEGAAFVYLGSAAGLASTPAWQAEGDQAFAEFGSSVAGAGDVNGDGFADVIVGAPRFDNGQTGEGAAFVYLGNEGLSRNARARQFESDGVTVIAPGGIAPAGSFQVSVFAPVHVGRTLAGIAVEVKPANVPFDGTNLVTVIPDLAFQDSTLDEARYDADVDLPTPGAWHWRAHLLGNPATTATAGIGNWGRWLRPDRSAGQSVDVRYALSTFDVTAAVVQGNGTVTPATQNVVFDGTASFTVTPDTGWSVDSVTGDTCTPTQVAGDNWEAPNIQADCAVEARFVINTYTVTAATGSGDGSITPPSQTVDHGADATFTVTPDTGWSVISVDGDTCTPMLDAGDQWIAADITEACAVTANFAQDTFDVTAAVVQGNGTVTPPTQNVVFDGTASFTVTPDTGWSVDSVTGDTCTPTQVAGDNWEAPNIQADCAVEARFVINTYTVTAATGSGDGSITPPSQTVDHGADATFTVTPDTGWSVTSVDGDTCTPMLDAGDQWVAADITEACSVTANFAQDTFDVTAAVVQGNGTITPATQNVVFDGTASFTVTPDTGWSVDSVTGDTCTPTQVAGDNWEAPNIQADCAVEARFVINTYTVTAATGSGDGSITPPSQTVDHGADATFTVTPDTGWSVTSVNGDTCTPMLDAGDQWIAADITEACAVTANFAQDTFDVTASVVQGNGTITPATQNVVFDDTASFTVTPDTGWSVDSVTGDTCTPTQVAGDNWEAPNIQADCAVEARFVINTYTVTAATGSGDGSITPPSQTVDHGADATFTVTPDTGWSVTSVNGDTCTPMLDAGDQWIAADITEACAVTANFAQDTFDVGGMVSGLLGDQVVLQNNGGDDQVITTDGGFTFSPQADETDYDVTVLIQPSDPIQTCVVSNGSGTLAGANVDDVQIECTTEPPSVELSLTEVDFGVLFTGEQETIIVTVTNTGTGELDIDAIGEPDAPFALTGGDCLTVPVQLQPGDSCEIEVTFAPGGEAGQYQSSIEILSNADSSPDAITARGAAAAPVPVPVLGPFGLLGLMLLLGGLTLRQFAGTARSAR